MSHWTYVRIIYDVEVPTRINQDGDFDIIGLTQLFKSAMYELEPNGILDLGSERPIDIDLKVFYGTSTHYGDKRIQVDDRGQIIIIGNLRDCKRKEFIVELNKFIKHLRNYGIHITDGLAKIEGD